MRFDEGVTENAASADNESDDSDAELDIESLERNSGGLHASTFSCISWDLPNGEEPKEENVCIIVMKDPDIVAMIKVGKYWTRHHFTLLANEPNCSLRFKLFQLKM